MRKILCMYTYPDLNAAELLLARLTASEVEVSLIENYGLLHIDTDKCTDIIMLGFSHSTKEIEKYYMSGILHILTIDYHKWDHPLKSLTAYKDDVPFLERRGKHAVLLDKEVTTIYNYLKKIL